MKIIDAIENFINSIKKTPPRLHVVISDPVGIVVAKVFFCDDLNRFMYETNNFPGLCPYCHNTLQKIPNLEFKTRTRKDIVCTYDGFYIVSEKFKSFCDEQISDYKKALDVLVNAQMVQYKEGREPQINILTDRLQLTEMHNCGAGETNITIAPNGKFYLCPAFYYDEKMGISNRLNHHKPSSERSVGDLDTGLQIPNPQLLKLDHAPLCRICDAYHCNRCIWLNQKLTWDNNTPSHQQCVLAHLERNTSRELQLKMMNTGFKFEQPIEEITYLDPFEVRIEF